MTMRFLKKVWLVLATKRNKKNEWGWVWGWLIRPKEKNGRCCLRAVQFRPPFFVRNGRFRLGTSIMVWMYIPCPVERQKEIHPPFFGSDPFLHRICYSYTYVGTLIYTGTYLRMSSFGWILWFLFRHFPSVIPDSPVRFFVSNQRVRTVFGTLP